MRRSLSDLLRGAVLAATAVVGLGPAPTVAQDDVEVVAKVVSMGSDEARLTLEFSDGSGLELALADGEVRYEGDAVGRYEPGGALERAWRDLVAQAVQIDDDALPQALVDWSPPEGLEGEAAEVGRRLDEILARRFDTASLRIQALQAREEAEALRELRGLESLAILSRLDRLVGLGDLVSELDDRNLRIVVDDHLEVEAGREIDGSILVVDGSLDLKGTIRGDVLVVDGEVDLHPGSRITGSLNLSDAELDNDGGEVDGGIEVVDRVRGLIQEEDLRSEILREIRAEMDLDRDHDSWTSPFRSVSRAIGNVFGILVKILILGGIGAALFHFAGPNMETVAEVARDSTGRAAVVGFAGAALLLPIFILGIVGLAVTIVGIPAILLWVVLFPAAALVAGLMGYLAVARNVGVWLERQRYGFAEWVRLSNPVTLVFGGLLTLMAPFIAGEILGILGFLGVFEVLLGITGFGMSVFAGAVGFGAVLITRGGRKPEEWGTEMFGRSWRESRWGRRGWWTGEAQADMDEFMDDVETATEKASATATAVADDVEDAADAAVQDAEDAVTDAAEELREAGEEFEEELYGRGYGEGDDEEDDPFLRDDDDEGDRNG